MIPQAYVDSDRRAPALLPCRPTADRRDKYPSRPPPTNSPCGKPGWLPAPRCSFPSTELSARNRTEAARCSAKYEQTIYCEMEPGQHKLYAELRQHYRDSLLRRIQNEGLERSTIQVLEALLHLRQAACHPGLLDPKHLEASSAKLDVLLEQLRVVLDEGHKALVFSQFTSLLAIVRLRLEREGIAFEYLDGKTHDRQARVVRFQEDPASRLFLISLKAGGLGLNLFAVRSAGRVGFVMKAAVGQRAAEPLVEEQKQQRDMHTLGGETVGVAAAIAFQQAVPFELAQIVAEMVQPVLFRGELERSEDGFMKLFGRRAANGVAAMQQDFQQADGPRALDFDAGNADCADGDGHLSMMHRFLLYANRSAASVQHRTIAVPEHMPAQTVDADLLACGHKNFS